MDDANAMSSATRLSPAASLLRSSRLFALPSPLKPPPLEASSGPQIQSDTATLPYPIRAAIETPKVCLNHGDWGLKRPLPLRSTTKTGTPIIRIQGGIETPEHTADFESAADHALTLRKWQTLNLPVSSPRYDSLISDVSVKSVFESVYDNTLDTAATLEDHQLGSSRPSPKRWRYAGPWLAGMTKLEFDTYIRNEVRKRKSEFEALVKRRMFAERKAALKRKAMEAGTTYTEGPEAGIITEEHFKIYMRRLRSKPELFGSIIAEFLDLPDGPTPVGEIPNGGPFIYGRSTVASKVYQNFGPPVSHPSAGLSYLRVGPQHTVRNDPVYGPQQSNDPVPARVLKTRSNAGAIKASIGIGGVVANNVDVVGTGRVHFEAFTPKDGGHKRVVRPSYASINSSGEIILDARTASTHQLAKNDGIERSDGPYLPATGIRGSGSSMPDLDDNYQRQPGIQDRLSPGMRQGIQYLKDAYNPLRKLQQ